MTTTFDPSQAPTLQANILDNGGFEIWQRGTTFTNPASPSYVADRWYVNATETTGVAVSQNSSVVDTGNYSLEANVTSAGASKTWNLAQIIENYTSYSGKALTFSCRVWANTASAVSIYLASGATNAQSSYHPGDSTWHTLTCTITAPNPASSLSINVGMINSGDKKVGTYYFDSAMLITGPNPALFVPLHPQIDLARCQRYYENIGTGANVQPIFPYNNTSNNGAFGDFSIPYHVTKRVAPSLTISITQIVLHTLPPGADSPVTDTPAWSAVNNSANIETCCLQFQRSGALASTRVGGFQFTVAVSADF